MNGVHLDTLLRAVADHERQSAPAPLREAVAMDLVELAARYGEGCPFKRGDLVTPRAGYCVTDPGEPNVVLDVFDPPHRCFPRAEGTEIWSNSACARSDMRVARVVRGVLTAFAAESWNFQAWAPPVAGSRPSPDGGCS